jgi:hypothetical protein
VNQTQQAHSPGIDDLLEVIEDCFERGWTDGLPVVPPTPGLVERFLSYTKRDPAEVIWYMSQVHRGCTVQIAAINAAMAGCRPEYFPTVLAALEATVDEGWPGNGGWQSTTGGGPLLIVNGPVRHEFGFNCKGNIFGTGFRPNATVGRAIRLIIMNAYGVRPHELDQATQGTSGKFGVCIGENEEDSPWEPLHVELGYGADTSTVSAIHVRSCEFIDNRNCNDPKEILDDIADTISRTGATHWLNKRIAVILGPEHAQLLARNGYSKQDVKEYFVAHTGRPAWMFRGTGKRSLTEHDGVAVPDDELVRIISSPDDILVAVAGALNAGVSAVAQPLGRAARLPGRAEIAS